MSYTKDEDAFITGRGTCYEVEDDGSLAKTKYDRADFMELCYDNPDLAEFVFDIVNGEHPSTALEDIKRRDMAEAPEMYGLEEPPQNSEEVDEALKNFTYGEKGAYVVSVDTLIKVETRTSKRARAKAKKKVLKGEKPFVKDLEMKVVDKLPDE